MRKTILFLFICLQLVFFGQTSGPAAKVVPIGFTEGHIHPNFFKSWQWQINGVTVNPDSDTLSFLINKNSFDTIFFRKDSSYSYKVITKFKKGHLYRILYSPCCNEFDIMDYNNSIRFVKGTEESEEPQIDDRTKIKFKITNYKDKDTITGIFGDIFGGFTSGAVLKNNAESKWLSPFRTGYSVFNYHIALAKTRKSAVENYEGTEHYVYGENEKEIQKVLEYIFNLRFRFFYEEKYLVTYNFETKQLNLKRK